MCQQYWPAQTNVTETIGSKFNITVTSFLPSAEYQIRKMQLRLVNSVSLSLVLLSLYFLYSCPSISCTLVPLSLVLLSLYLLYSCPSISCTPVPLSLVLLPLYLLYSCPSIFCTLVPLSLVLLSLYLLYSCPSISCTPVPLSLVLLSLYLLYSVFVHRESVNKLGNYGC